MPDRAELGITVRALSEAALERPGSAVERIVRAECAASGCPAEPEIAVVSRSAVNVPDRAATETVRRAHLQLYGPERVAGWLPSMATEDFPLFGDAGLSVHGLPGIPLVYWMLGTVGPGQWAKAPGSSAAQKLAALPPTTHPSSRRTSALRCPRAFRR